MASSGNSSPKILKSTALAKATALDNRINTLLPDIASTISPVTVYLPGTPVAPELDTGITGAAGGTWICPDGVNSIQVECWGAGGGAGGGTLAAGGSGGGAGEYAGEDNYPVVPGTPYAFAVGRAGQSGVTGSAGSPGGDTVFDTQGTGISGGVYAHGGGGGDAGSQNNGGTGSSNSRHADGGAGGVSVSGIASDDPTLVPDLLFWWPLDDTLSINSSYRDRSANNYYGTPVPTNGTTYATIDTSDQTAPAQVPTETIAGISGQGIAQFIDQDIPSPGVGIQAPSFGLGHGVAAPEDGALLTVSAWVQGDGVISNSWSYGARYGTTYGTIAANCDYPAGIHGTTGTGSNGFALFLKGSTPGFYLGNGTTLSAIYAPSAFAAPDNVTWHQIVGTWDGTTQTLYVDGALVASATPTLSYFAQGTSRIEVGCNPHTQADSFLCGNISNVWLAASTATAGFIGQAYGTSSVLGGSGGGASGGSGGAGTPGSSAMSSSGAAGGAGAAGVDALHGASYAGGAGGNSNSNGSPPAFIAPYGGGGGGAGAAAAAGAVTTITAYAQHSATYTGLDAAGGNVGQLYDISDTPQAGVTDPYPAAALLSPYMYVGGDPSDSFNGSKNAMALLPNLTASFTALTANSATLSFTVQSVNASVLAVRYALLTAQSGQNAPILPTSLTDADLSNFTTPGAQVFAVYPLVTIPVPAGAAGRRISFDVTDTTFLTKLNTYQVALLFGGCQGSGNTDYLGNALDTGDGAYSDSDSYAWNTVLNGASSNEATDDVQISFAVYPAAGGNKTGGDGKPGRILLTYIVNGSYPITSIQAQDATDDQGNQFASGITTDTIVGFDPTVTTVPRQPEAWRPLGTLSSGSGLFQDKGRYRYSPEDGGTLVIQFNAYAATGAVAAGTYTFPNLVNSVIIPTVSANAANDQYVENLSGVNMGTTLAGVIYVNGVNYGYGSPGLVTVRIPTTIAAGNPVTLSAILRIPLA